MKIPVRTMQDPPLYRGELTTEHSASGYGQPVLLIAGVVYGPRDEIPGIGPPFLYAGHHEGGLAPLGHWTAVGEWNLRVRADDDAVLIAWLGTL